MMSVESVIQQRKSVINLFLMFADKVLLVYHIALVNVIL